MERNLDIILTDDTVTYSDGKNAGKLGEHNATQLTIQLPELLRNDIDHHIIVFNVGGHTVHSGIITSDSTNGAYLSGDSIICLLWQELTLVTPLSFTVEAYKLDSNNEPIRIAKSPLVKGLYFELIAGNDADPADNSAYGLSAEVIELKALSHTHTNKALLDTYSLTQAELSDTHEKAHEHDNGALLDTYTQTEAQLADAVARTHTHLNASILDSITELHDSTKANKAASPTNGNLAELDSSGNLVDSGLCPDDLLSVVSLSGSGGITSCSALDDLTDIGVRIVTYSDTLTQDCSIYTVRNVMANGSLLQSVASDGLIAHRTLSDNAWGTWQSDKIITLSPLTSTPSSGSVPIYGNSGSSLSGVCLGNSGVNMSDLVLRVDGKELSSNDYTDAEKEKLSCLSATVDAYSDLLFLSSPLPPVGTRARVLNDGDCLDFDTYAQLIFNAAIADVDVPLLPSLPTASIDSGENTDCVSFSLGTNSDGTPLIILYVSIGDETYSYFSRSYTSLGTTVADGWYYQDNGTDVPCAAPVLTSFTISRFGCGGVYYDADDNIPDSAAAVLKMLSRIVNTAYTEMHRAGEYVFSGTDWVYSHGDDELLTYSDTLEANRRYTLTTGSDLSITLPTSGLDPTRDNAILLYLNCTADIDVAFPVGTLLYYGMAPDTSQGLHDLIMVYRPNCGAWAVGGLDASEVSL